MVKKSPVNAGDLGNKGLISGDRKVPWRRKWQPTPVFLPGKYHGQRNVTTVHGVTKESDTTE